MSVVVDAHVTNPQQLIEREIEKAKEELRPISRHSLALMLVREQKLNPKEAEEIVDEYCDEKAPYTPTYLTNEFLLPYIKLASLFVVVGSLVVIGYAVHLWENHKPSWMYFAGGAILFVFSGVGMMKILRVERESAQ